MLDSLGSNPPRWVAVRDALGQLQSQFELEADDFCATAGALKQQEGGAALSRQANLLMQSHVERYEALLESLAAPARVLTVSAGVPLP